MATSHVSKSLLKDLVRRCRNRAPEIELLFVTNLIDGEIEHYTETGLSMSSQYYREDIESPVSVMSSQYYRESEISLILQSLGALGFSVRPFYNEIDFITWVSDRTGAGSAARWQLVVTTAEGGEGQSRRALIPAFCNLVGLPCWNSPAHGSSVARHKFHANRILRATGFRVPETWYFSFERRAWLHGHAPEPGLKVIVKPAWEGGSKGIDDNSVFIADDDLTERVSARAASFGQSCVVQEFRTGYEIGVPIVCVPETVGVGLIGFADGDQLRYGGRPRTFEDEKINKSARNFLFESIPERQADRVLRAAERAFDTLAMKGLGRIDMRIDEDGEGWIFDTNESPPPLPRSSFVQLFEYFGFDYKEVLAIMIGVNLLRFGRLAR